MSLPAGRPAGTVRVRPRMPREAIRSRCGVRACSSGVLPPSWAIGSSAMPSATRTTYFTVLIQLQDGREPAQVGGDRDRGLRVGDGVVGVLEAVAGERQHQHI